MVQIDFQRAIVAADIAEGVFHLGVVAVSVGEVIVAHCHGAVAIGYCAFIFPAGPQSMA